MSDQIKELVMSRVSYDPETGIVTRRVKSVFHKRWDGTEVKGSKTRGYVMFYIGKKRFWAHRVAFLFMTGDWPAGVVDHINRDKSDNRWVNMRVCTQAQNSCNRSVQSNNTSGVRGVSRVPGKDKWVAVIKFNRRTHYIGQFNSIEEASAARRKAAERFYGEFLGQHSIIQDSKALGGDA